MVLDVRLLLGLGLFAEGVGRHGLLELLRYVGGFSPPLRGVAPVRLGLGARLRDELLEPANDVSPFSFARLGREFRALELALAGLDDSTTELTELHVRAAHFVEGNR